MTIRWDSCTVVTLLTYILTLYLFVLKPYPSVMVTSAMNDDRVPYWLPLKWVARLRDQLSPQELEEKPLIVCHVDYYGRHSETEGMYRRIEKVEF